MDTVKDYIKICLRKNSLSNINSEKINIISSSGYFKVFHMTDLLFYLSGEEVKNISICADKIIKQCTIYNEAVKKKIFICILCITNLDLELIEYIINQLYFTKAKILLVAPNNNFFQLAYKFNLDYIISTKKEYMSNIQAGLTYLKNCKLDIDNILVSNTETIIHPATLTQTINRFSSIFNFAGPVRIGYINYDTNEIFDIKNDSLFLVNWFLISKRVLDKINWGLFDGSNIDIYKLLETNINRTNSKVLKINVPSSICFNYYMNEKFIKKIKLSRLENLEYTVLQTYLNNVTSQNTIKIRNNIEQINTVYPNIDNSVDQIVIDRTRKKMEVKVMTVGETAFIDRNRIIPINSVKISKFYFINTVIQPDIINNKVKNILNPINYTILSGSTDDRTKLHLVAIKDASTRRLDQIAIIEDSLIDDAMINKINNIQFPINPWSIILLIDNNGTNNINMYELDVNNKQVYNNNNKILSYCLHTSFYRNIISPLDNKKNITDVIDKLQQLNKGIYVYFDNFTSRKVIINKTNKIVEDVPQMSRNIIYIPNNNIQLKVIHPSQTDLNSLPVLNKTIFDIPQKEPIHSISSVGQIKDLIKVPKLIDIPTPIQPIMTHINKIVKKEYSLPIDIPKPDDKSNKIVQGLWIGESLSLNEIMCIMSFIKCGHEFHLYVYEKVQNIPKECIVKDGNEILSESEIFYYSAQQSVSGKRRPTAFSNMFRYKLLLDKGGYWVDMDMICVKKLDFPDPYVFSSENVFSKGQVTNAGIIKCPKGSNFAKYCYDICKAKDKTKIKWGEIGPALVNEGVKLYGLSQYVKPWFYFCPIGYDKLADLIKPKQKDIIIQENWYCIHLWNEFWVKNNWDKNKIYYGSLFGHLVNKYCKKYVDQEIFNLEFEYGKYNKSAVLFYWMPQDETLANEFESLLNKLDNLKDIYNIDTCCIHKDIAKSNKDEIKNFIDTDIYVHMFSKLLDSGIIDNLHIIFGMANNDKYVYNREPLFTNGNYCNYNKNIHLWKINDSKGLLSFANAKLYYYKGYGNYEHFYSILTTISPNSIFTRYLATAFPYKDKIQDKPIIDDSWIDTYSRNDLCRNKVKNFNKYLHSTFANYDLVQVNTSDKIPHYKKLFINTKKFSKFKKFSVMTFNKDTKRIYDLVFCASDIHPSKNWEIFFKFLSYCESHKKELNVLVISPNIGGKNLDKYARFKYVKTTIKRGLSSNEMNNMYNMSKTLLVTFGRDANPRVISESLNCGCYNIILDILSDGKDIVANNPLFGQVIKIPGKNIIYNPTYKSVKCILTDEQHNHIYNLIKKDYDHALIANTFANTYNANITTNEFIKDIMIIERVKQKMVVTLATENYSKSMNYLLSSLQHTNPGLRVLVYYVDWRESLLEQFTEAYPNYQFEEIVMNKYTKGDILKLKVKLQHDTYFKYKIPYIWIDADSVVLKNMNTLFDKLMTHGLVCYHRPNEHDYMKFAVGVIGFGINKDKDNNINEEFLKAYYKQCSVTKGHNDWFYDQSALWETYTNTKISLYQLKENEHSIKDTPNTIIYSRRINNKLTTSKILEMYNIHVSDIDFKGIDIMYD